MDGTTQLLESDRRYLVHPLHHPDDHRQPLVVVEGKGAILRDAEGREYIDGLSGLWNVNVGHGRGELADAASRADAPDRLRLGLYRRHQRAGGASRREDRPPRLSEFRRRLFHDRGRRIRTSPRSRFARYYWKVKDQPQKTKIISRIHAYHGVTMAAMSATGMAAYHKMFGPLVPGFIQVAPPYAYRWSGNEEPGVGAADAVEKAILAEGPETVAAVIAEPVMGAGGVIVPPPVYFPRLREICDRHDVLLIADEVITGFGRTGRWFALGHWGVEPDLVSFAKGVTSGYLPLGGVIASKRVHEAIESAPADRKFMHAATYSGHPVCCAVGLRNVEIIESEGLVERAAVMGRRLLAGLEELARPAGRRRCARARHDVRRRAGDRPQHQSTGARARGPLHARGAGARAAPAHSRRQRRPADRRHDLPRPAADRPRPRCSTASRRSCARQLPQPRADFRDVLKKPFGITPPGRLA